MKHMEFIAVCAYDRHTDFLFYSPAFFVTDWSSLETVGEQMVKDAWAKISPHEAPKILRYEPGALVHDTHRESHNLQGG